MTVFTKNYSSPVHIENSVLNMTKDDLKLPNAFRTYKEMSFDPIISSSVSFICSVLNKKFYFKPHLRSTQKERQCVEALNRSLEDLEPYSQNRVMSNILQLISYGSSIQEYTFHRKDGFQVLKSFTPIAIENVNKFEYENGYLKKIKLNPANNDGLITDSVTKQKEIPGDKVLMVSFQADGSNPLGKSLLNSAFTTWKQKTSLTEINLIGAYKALAGQMQISIPASYLQAYFNDPQSSEATMVHQLIQQAELAGVSKTSFMVIPSDTYGDGQNQRMFSVEPIKGVDGKGFEIEQSIERCNRELHQALQSSVLSLGQDSSSGSGSYGLSSTKSVLLHQFLKGVHESIGAELRKVLKTAFELNGLSDTRLPSIEWEELQEPTWEEFTAGLKDIGMSGFVEPTGELNRWVIERMGAPSNAVGSGAAGDLVRTVREQQGGNQDAE